MAGPALGVGLRCFRCDLGHRVMGYVRACSILALRYMSMTHTDNAWDSGRRSISMVDLRGSEATKIHHPINLHYSSISLFPQRLASNRCWRLRDYEAVPNHRHCLNTTRSTDRMINALKLLSQAHQGYSLAATYFVDLKLPIQAFHRARTHHGDLGPGCLCLDFTWLTTCAHCVHGASTWSRPISPILLVYQWTPSVENQSRLVLILTRVWQRKRRFQHYTGIHEGQSSYGQGTPWKSNSQRSASNGGRSRSRL